jgi:hypothetical protein
MVTTVTVRLGLVSALAALVVGAPNAVSAVASTAAPSAVQTKTVQARTVGDHCLVGTWRARPALVKVRFRHKEVTLHYGGGDWLHVHHNGDVVDHYNHSRVFEAFPNGLLLKLHIRGTFTEHLRGLYGTSPGKGDTLKVLHVSDGVWQAGSAIHATYNGHKVKFHFTGFQAHFDGYTCRNHGLFFIDQALDVHQTYDRRSFVP